MSERTLSISEAQAEFANLADQFEQGLEAVTITRDGEAVMIALPFEKYTHLYKTVEELKGKTESLQKVLKEELARLDSLNTKKNNDTD